MRGTVAQSEIPGCGRDEPGLRGLQRRSEGDR
jgi:hypothetical protein